LIKDVAEFLEFDLLLGVVALHKDFELFDYILEVEFIHFECGVKLIILSIES
jgi:hypothetical protein